MLWIFPDELLCLKGFWSQKFQIFDWSISWDVPKRSEITWSWVRLNELIRERAFNDEWRGQSVRSIICCCWFKARPVASNCIYLFQRFSMLLQTHDTKFYIIISWNMSSLPFQRNSLFQNITWNSNDIGKKGWYEILFCKSNSMHMKCNIIQPYKALASFAKQTMSDRAREQLR